MILTLTPNPSIDRTVDLAEPLVRDDPLEPLSGSTPE